MESRFLNIDCMEYMKDVPDNYFELAIVDPPYGIGFDRENLSMSCGMRKDGSKRKYNDWSNPVQKGYKDKSWDEAPSDDYFDELFRISKNQIIWGGNYFNLPITGGWIIWDKKVKMPSLSKGEMAWTKIINHLEIFTCLWAGYRKDTNSDIYEKRIHPTQKPVKLYQWLLQNYAKPNDKIFDSHVGSGSSLIACIEEGFNYIGCELDKDYYKDANNRIEVHKSQLKLF